MFVTFVKLFLEDSKKLDYLLNKWKSVIKDNPVLCFERSLDVLDSIKKISSASFLGKHILPPYEEEHRQVASKWANRVMPLLEGESPTEPDHFDVLGEDSFGVPKNTLVLRRKTNFSESVYVIPSSQVIRGTLYRFQSCVNGHEKKLATLQNATLITEETACWNESPVAVTAEPITMSLVAGKITLAILTGAASQIGSKAMGWALSQMGITDINTESQLSYDRLVEALKRQSREDFRRNLNIKFNQFYRLQQDINGGMRTKEMLEKLYHEIRSITSWLEFEERSPDRLHQLAFAQSLYLATMQEMAEFWRESDPEKMKQFYMAQSARAGREITVLQTVRQEAYNQRMSHITELEDRRHPLSDYRVVSFGDIEPARERSWELAQIRCTQTNMRTGVCEKWEWTQKGRDTRAALHGRLSRHRAWISERTNAVLNIDKVIENFTKIRDRENPPPPPR